METKFKCRLLFSCIAALVLGIVFYLVFAGDPTYRAQSMVITSRYTNAFFATAFEEQVIAKIPKVTLIKVVPTFNTKIAKGAPNYTNGVAIRLIVTGATAQDAELAANEAAKDLRSLLVQQYDCPIFLIEKADQIRRYSFFHDSFQPKLIRLLSRAH